MSSLFHHQHSHRANSRGNLSSIYAGNLNWKTTSSTIMSIFRHFESVCDVHISQKAKTNSNSLYAFVRFGSPGDAHRAITSMDGLYALGRRLILRKARPRSRDLYRSNGNFTPTNYSTFFTKEDFQDQASVFCLPSFFNNTLSSNNDVSLHAHVPFEPELLRFKCQKQGPKQLTP